MATTLTFTSAPFIETTVFNNADSTTAKTILTADATFARRVYGITVYTDETTPRDITIQLTNPGGTSFILTTMAIAANAGNTNAILPADLFTQTQMAPLVKQRDAAGAAYLNIPIGWHLKVAYKVAIVSPRFANFVVMGETYA
jgi:hypothetical protein